MQDEPINQQHVEGEERFEDVLWRELVQVILENRGASDESSLDSNIQPHVINSDIKINKKSFCHVSGLL